MYNSNINILIENGRTIPVSEFANSSLLYFSLAYDKLYQAGRLAFKNVLHRDGGLVRVQIQEEAQSILELCAESDGEDQDLLSTHL